MVEIHPESEGRSGRRGLSAARIGLIVGVVALALAGVAGGLVIAGRDSSSPEGTVRDLFTALDNEDLIGVGQVLDPTERELVVDTLTTSWEELKRLQVIDSGAELTSPEWIDLQFSDMEFTVENLDGDLAWVEFTGTSNLSADPSRFPFGSFVDRAVARLAPDAGNWRQDLEPVPSSTQEFDGGLAVVRRDGRWRVSIAYTIAERLRRDAGLDLPPADQALVPVGADSPGGVVQALIGAVNDLDPVAAIRVVDPDEASAALRYAPLYVDQLESAADSARSFLEDQGVSYSIQADSETFERDGRTYVTVVPNLLEFSVEGEGGVTVRRTPECLKVETSGSFEDPSIPQDVCLEELLGEMGGFGLTPLEGGLGLLPGSGSGLPADGPRQGLEVIEVDGEWYLRPLHTVTDSWLDTLMSLQPEDLDSTLDVLESLMGPFGMFPGATEPLILQG